MKTFRYICKMSRRENETNRCKNLHFTESFRWIKREIHRQTRLPLFLPTYIRDFSEHIIFLSSFSWTRGIAVESLFYYSRDPHREGEDTLLLFDINIRPSGIPLKFASLRALMPWICPIFFALSREKDNSSGGSAIFQHVRRDRNSTLFFFFLHFILILLYYARSTSLSSFVRYGITNEMNNATTTRVITHALRIFWCKM